MRQKRILLCGYEMDDRTTRSTHKTHSSFLILYLSIVFHIPFDMAKMSTNNKKYYFALWQQQVKDSETQNTRKSTNIYDT